MLYEVIKKLQETKGTNAKLDVLSENVDNTILTGFLKAVYEPTYSYYITKLPPEAVYGDYNDGPVDLSLIVDTLSKLQRREVTGFAAKQFITSQVRLMNEKTFELFKMAINRDIKAGIATTAINKTWPGLVTVIPYQRCTLPKDSNIKKWLWATPGFFAYSQIKADGMYANVNVSSTGNKDGFGAPFNTVVVTSRNGSVFPMGSYFDGLVQDAVMLASKLHPSNTQLQGELLVTLHGQVLPREKGNGILNSILQSGEDPGAGYKVIMVVWDAIPLTEATSKNVYKVRYDTRYTSLKQCIENSTLSTIRLVETQIVTTYVQATAHLLEAWKRGEEGTILKHPDSYWIDGDNKDQVKGKLEFVVDLVIVGYKDPDPNGKYAHLFGSLLCQTSDGQLEVGVSGMPDATRLEIHNNRDYYLGKIVSVMTNGIMFSERADEPHSLFLPRLMNKDKTKLVDIRLDKSSADSFAQVVAQYEAARAGANL